MMSNYLYSTYNYSPMYNWMFSYGTFAWLMPLMMLDLALKGVALWKSARSNKLYWFIAILLINSLGILPLIYLVFFEKKKR